MEKSINLQKLRMNMQDYIWHKGCDHLVNIFDLRIYKLNKINQMR